MKYNSTGTPPQSVTCSSDLPGEVGKTADCEVVVNDTTSIQATVTVTKVNGSNIDYDFTPSMTKEQLEKAFAANVSAQVTCNGGLDGDRVDDGGSNNTITYRDGDRPHPQDLARPYGSRRLDAVACRLSPAKG